MAGSWRSGDEDGDGDGGGDGGEHKDVIQIQRDTKTA